LDGLGRSPGRTLSHIPDRSDLMLALAVILLIVWALGFLVFKVAAFFIHVLIILAVIAFVMHFVRKGKRTTV
jgi:hypothetical protein